MKQSSRTFRLYLSAIIFMATLSACSAASSSSPTPSPRNTPAERRQSEPSLNPVKWSVETKATGKLRPGDSFAVLLSAEIEKGWHLYSTEEIPEGPRPTRITLAPEQPFEISGEIESPEPKSAHDENFNITTQFFENAVTFRLPVRLLPNAAAGNNNHNKVIVQVRYQACNDHLCLPPKTMKLEAPLETVSSEKPRS